MLNLYYRGYVVHEDIRSICYTIFDCRPHRIELGNSGTALEAMRWIDRDVARRLAGRSINRGIARSTSNNQARSFQHASL
jgi:hypothetical protein